MVQKTGTEVTVRNEAGGEFRRNSAFVKKYNEQDSVSRPNGKENSSPEEVGQRETITGVPGNSPVPLQSSSEKGGETGSQMQTESPLISQQITSKGNHVTFARFVFLPSVKKQKHEFNFFFAQCIIKQLLNSVFVISRIIKVSERVISLSLRLRLITLISTLIIRDITNTSSNNCLVTNRATKQTYHNPKLIYSIASRALQLNSV